MWREKEKERDNRQVGGRDIDLREGKRGREVIDNPKNHATIMFRVRIAESLVKALNKNY